MTHGIGTDGHTVHGDTIVFITPAGTTTAGTTLGITVEHGDIMILGIMADGTHITRIMPAGMEDLAGIHITATTTLGIITDRHTDRYTDRLIIQANLTTSIISEVRDTRPVQTKCSEAAHHSEEDQAREAPVPALDRLQQFPAQAQTTEPTAHRQ